jgi:prephenate dehydrogenase
MRIAIIGGTGEMGQWFAAFFRAKGHSVVISGRHYKKCLRVARKLRVSAAKSNADAVKGADLVMVSVLMSGFKDVIKGIAPHLEKGQKLIDVTSVKEKPVQIMHKYIKNAVALGTHPMFGPSAKAAGQNFILTPTNSSEARFARELGRMLRGYKFRVRTLTPRKHDEMIGAILSLTHFVGLVTADAWRGLKIERYINTSSTSFRFLLQFAKSVVDSSPELYSYLQMDVPRVEAAERHFVVKAESWSWMIKQKRRSAFKRKMTALSKYLNGLELE